MVIDREISVLNWINERYFGIPPTTNNALRLHLFGTFSIPDKDIGYRGEELVYEQEVAYALANNIPASEVQWVSQAVPQSPYDIKSVRITNDSYRDHFIEVKSSRTCEGGNIYVSSRQIEFFKSNPNCSAFKLVSFLQSGELDSIRELSFSQLNREFDFTPIKFRLRLKES